MNKQKIDTIDIEYLKYNLGEATLVLDEITTYLKLLTKYDDNISSKELKKLCTLFSVLKGLMGIDNEANYGHCFNEWSIGKKDLLDLLGLYGECTTEYKSKFLFHLLSNLVSQVIRLMEKRQEEEQNEQRIDNV